jgi:5'-nucleotidase
MRLLCTNDDGILAYGLECLVRAAEALGESPLSHRTASRGDEPLGCRFTIRFGRVKRGERRYQVDGTPTDCVMLAVEALMEQRPDYVLSGINHGQNMGEDVLYSGTVAAGDGRAGTRDSVIVHPFAGGDLRADVSLLDEQVEILSPLLAHLTRPEVSEHTLLNVNLAAAAPEISGKPTRPGRRVYSDRCVPWKTRGAADLLDLGLINWEASGGIVLPCRR